MLGIEISQGHKKCSASPDAVASHDIIPAGTVFGLHNIAICIPQLMISLASSYFWRSESGWVLMAGGVAALVALVLTLRIRDPEAELVNEIFEGDVALESMGLAMEQRGLISDFPDLDETEHIC
jgi:hypothetical protein